MRDMTKNHFAILCFYKLDLDYILQLYSICVCTYILYIMCVELEYADKDLRQILNAFTKTYKHLVLNLKKDPGPPSRRTLLPRLPPSYVDDTRLRNVEQFPHFGSLLSSKPTTASRVLENHNLQAKNSFLFSETWTTYSRHLKALAAP